MKNSIIKKIFAILIILFFFKIPCFATENNINDNNTQKILNEQYDKLNLNKLEDAIPKETKEDLHNIGINPQNPQDIQNFNITNLFSYIASKISKILKTPLTIFINCIAIMLLCAIFNSFKTTACGENLKNVIGALIALCTCGILITPIIKCVTDISEIIKNFSNFMLCFIPVFVGLIAMSKGILTSITYNSTMFILAQLISYITSDLLLPITGSFLALSISGSVNESFNITGLTGAVKKVIIFTLSLLVTIFVGIFSIQNTISVNADSMGFKTAKFLSSSFIPIIGGSLGDALASIVGGLNIIKSAVGGLGILICILTLVPPILTVGFFIIFSSFAKEIATALEIPTMTKILGSIKDCLSILLAFLICYGILIISTTTIIITMGAK